MWCTVTSGFWRTVNQVWMNKLEVEANPNLSWWTHAVSVISSPQPSFSPHFCSLPHITTKKKGRRKNLRPNTGKAALGGRGETVSSPCWLGAQVGCLFGQTDPVSWGFHSVLAQAHAGSLPPRSVKICCSLLQNWMSHSPDISRVLFEWC